jgi:hypothetical protein
MDELTSFLLPRRLMPAPTSLPLLTAIVLLSGCSNLSLRPSHDSAVVYALGSQNGFPSPLSKQLTPACPALTFHPDHYTPIGRHRLSLQQIANASKTQSARHIIAGYTSPELPQDYARSLSERRAQAIRQSLIELGVEPAQLQTIGFGNDFALSGPSTDVVVIYRADSPTTSSDPAPPAPAQ